MAEIAKKRLVIALDFGTARSGWAYIFYEDDDKNIVLRDRWDGSAIFYPKTDTHFLLDTEGKRVAWGYEAAEKLAKLRNEGGAKGYHFIERFKMKLYDDQNAGPDGPYYSQNKKFLVLNLIADFLGLLKKDVLDNIRQSIGDSLNENEIQWCLTIPAIWKDVDKDLMRRAAQKAGLINPDAYDPTKYIDDLERFQRELAKREYEQERLLLCLEPEAAAIYCQKLDESKLQSGQTLMIVDAGGGTVDITVHKVDQGKGLHEIAPGTGGPFGSTYVNENFVNYLKKILSPEAINKYQTEEPIDYHKEIKQRFETLKVEFNPTTSEDVIYFPISLKFYNLLNKDYPKLLQKLAVNQDGDDETIHISRETIINEIFGPTINGLIGCVEDEFANLKKNQQECEFIFLVGGFSEAPLLRQRIQEKFESQVEKIVMPKLPGSAILRGAASFAKDPSVIRSRRARLTYGVSFSPIFDPSIHDPERKFWAEDWNEFLCAGCFDTLVKINDSVPTDAEIAMSWAPVSKLQRDMSFKFFASRKRDVMYVDESDVTLIGEMELEMPFTTGGINRQVLMTFFFGQTEIKVHAKELREGGNEVSTKLRFSSSF